MVRFILLSLAVLGLGCSNFPDPDPDPGPSPGPFQCDSVGATGLVLVDNPIPRSFIVVLKEGQSARNFVGAYGIDADEVFESALQGFTCHVDLEAAVEMAHDPRVAFVQQNGQKHASLVTWGIDRSDQRDLPLDGIYAPRVLGRGVHTYVLDTGVDVDHVEFTGRIGEGFSAVGGDFLDDHGHGTHVAGTVGGTEFGIAKKVVIHPVRVLVNGSGSDSQVIAGIDWVTAHVQQNGWPAVANMSLGGGVSPALDMAVCNSIQAGISYAVAAGNDNGGDACLKSPSRVAEALSAGATTRTDVRASFSNVGVCVNVFAPGEDIESARRGGGSRLFSGTSMASPHVAGTAALCLERNPGSTPEQVTNCVLDNASRDKLTGIGTDSPNLLIFVNE